MVLREEFHVWVVAELCDTGRRRTLGVSLPIRRRRCVAHCIRRSRVLGGVRCKGLDGIVRVGIRCAIDSSD